MVKSSNIYICSECGYSTTRWIGKCPKCNVWASIEERESINTKGGALNQEKFSDDNLISLKKIEVEKEYRYITKLEEFDRVLGGGLIKGEVVLVTGNPGIGKSTLLLQVISEYSKYGDTIYISGEESPAQLRNRSKRLGIDNENIYIMSETDISKTYEYIMLRKPKVVVVDSIQTIYNSQIDSVPGTPTQIRECTLKIIELAKKNDISFFIVGHITKDGKVAGPKLLEHMVDAVFTFEGEEGLFYRIIRSIKNRFGSTNELAVFSMEENGMKEIKNSSEYFLSEREEKNIGSMVVPVLEGTKVFLLEIQSLLTDVRVGIPKRIVQGFDRNRMEILIGIAEKKMNLDLSLKDIFINIPGGLSVKDPAGDLATIISMLSVYKNVTISQKIAAIGELGLRGEIRKVFFIDKRLRELEKLGFKGVYIPESNRKEIEKNKYDLKLIYLRNIEELLERMNKDG